MKRILITGSTGFVGTHLLEKLNGNDHLVKTINREFGHYKYEELEKINEDFDLIFILFALLPNKESSLEDFLEVNFNQVKKIVDKFPNARFIFTSTISVYENSPHKPCTEDDLSNKISDYAKSKLKAEELFENKNAIVLRLSSLYGPKMKENTFLPLVVNSALEKKEVSLWGDGKRKQNYLYIEDLIDGLIEAGFSDETGVFNLVNNRSYSNKELIDTIVSLVSGLDVKHIEDKNNYYSYEISNEKWFNCFKHESKISLKEGLRRYLEYKQNA